MANSCKSWKKGFTLIELMIVIAIIGFLAAVAIPQFSNMRKKSMNASAKLALRNLKVAQESFWMDFNIYANKIGDLVSWYVPEENVKIHILAGDNESWSAWSQYKGSDDKFVFNSSEEGIKAYQEP